MPYTVAVLASGTGSNLRALTEAARQSDGTFAVSLVVGNNSGSGALAHAREQGIEALHLSGRTHPDPDLLDRAMLGALRRHRADLVVTAGYLKKVGPSVLAAYRGRILNVHPALLPEHGGPGMYGERVHRAVLAAGDTVSGVSVHHLTAEYDEGPVIARRQVPVLAGDTPDTLAARVLRAEHELLPAVLRALAADASAAGGSAADSGERGEPVFEQG